MRNTVWVIEKVVFFGYHSMRNLTKPKLLLWCKLPNERANFVAMETIKEYSSKVSLPNNIATNTEALKYFDFYSFFRKFIFLVWTEWGQWAVLTFKKRKKKGFGEVEFILDVEYRIWVYNRAFKYKQKGFIITFFKIL